MSDYGKGWGDAQRGERERCIAIVKGFMMTGPSPIGPLHGAGWNDAVTRIVKALESGQTGKAQP